MHLTASLYRSFGAHVSMATLYWIYDAIEITEEMCQFDPIISSYDLIGIMR
jgi:hypothetical protein